MSSTSILLTWDIDSTSKDMQNVTITMYKVMYQPLETFGGAIEPRSVNVTEQELTLMELHEAVNYTITVQAFTGIGEAVRMTQLTLQTREDGNYQKCCYICS